MKRVIMRVKFGEVGLRLGFEFAACNQCEKCVLVA